MSAFDEEIVAVRRQARAGKGVSGARIALALLVVSCARPHPQAPPPRVEPEKQETAEAPPTLRLPTDVHVLAEKLDLDLDASRSSFRGSADIDVNLERPRRTLWLHGRDLRVQRVTVTSGSRVRTIEGRWAARADGIASIALDEALPAGHASIHVDYEADFTTSDVGVQRIEKAGRRYLFSQFALTDARRAFPCFDEPSFKSPFTVAITAPSADDEVVANTNALSTTVLAGGRVRVQFAETPALPAYLVAFAVGPFDVVRAPDVPPNAIRARPLALRGVTTQGGGKRFTYALARAPEVVAALEEYFHAPFPFEKLDLIAVPEKPGAMENAGAITFGEEWILHDDVTGRESDERYILSLLAHEIAHQWLGDLVTTSWWDDMWLNEASATWMAAKIADQVAPSANVHLLNLANAGYAMSVDARAAARSVRQPILSSDDIANTLDAITYFKGAAALGMFERWIGPEKVKGGLRRYVASHARGSATANDMFAELSAAAGRDVAEPFRTFLEQPGVPLVDVQVRCDRAPLAHLVQSRFVPLGSTVDARGRWSIPVCLRYESGGSAHETCTLLEDHESDLALEGCPTWLMPNAEGAGYYRFALSHDALAGIRQHLDLLSSSEIIALASSLRAGLVSGATSVPDVFETVPLFARDERPEVLDEAVGTLAMARTWLFGDPALAAFEAYAARLAQPAYRHLGWEPRAGAAPESAREQTRRATTLDLLTNTARVPAARLEARRRARRFLGIGGDGRIHRDAVLPDLQGTALTVAAQDGDQRLFEAVLAHLGHVEDVELRRMLVDTLAAFQDRALAARTRELALGDVLHGSEPVRVLYHQLATLETRDDAWRWLLEHGDALLARNAQPTIRHALIRAVGNLCDGARSGEIESFLGHIAPNIDGGPREAASARERATLCARQREALRPALRAFFGGRAP